MKIVETFSPNIAKQYSDVAKWLPNELSPFDLMLSTLADASGDFDGVAPEVELSLDGTTWAVYAAVTMAPGTPTLTTNSAIGRPGYPLYARVAVAAFTTGTITVTAVL